jgi:hypothetical protein
MSDLDDLLDDIEIDDTLGGPANNTEKYLWRLSGLPEDMQQKWAKWMDADNNDNADKRHSKFMYSHEYRCWDDSKNISRTPAAHKLLQDAVRQACVRSGFDDRMTTKLMTMSNPIESESGKILQDSYNRQIFTDLKRFIVSNPDYDPEQFPAIAKLFAT